MSTLSLITGASGGIGLELAKIMAANKHDLVLVARNKIKLEEAASQLAREHRVKVQVIDLDLSRHGSALELYNRTKSLGLEIDILVNNAGFGEVGEFIEQDTRMIEEMMTLNMEGLTLLCRYFLPDMKKRGSGRILNVASTAAFQPGPYLAVYYATKAYVLSLGEALHHELQDTGITVTTLCPGPTITGFQERANLKTAKMLEMPGQLTAQEVAELGFKALMKGKMTQIAGFANWLGTFSVRLSPRNLTPRLVARFNKNR